MNRSLSFLALLPLTACVAVHEVDSVFVQEPFDSVSVYVDSGTVTIVAADDEPVRVERDLAAMVWNPASSHVEVMNNTLSVRASCGGKPTDICSADLTLFVPTDVTAIVNVGWGDIVASGLAGGLGAETGAGDIELTDLSGAVEAQTYAGDVVLDGLSGPVRADTDAGDVLGVELTSPELVTSTGAGDIDVQLVGTVDKIDARNSAGDIDLRVPAGRYALDLHTDVGDVVVEGISDDPMAAPIHVAGAAGDIRIVGE